MALNIGTVANTNSFQYWIDRTNDTITSLNSKVLTVGANTTSGNSVVNGSIQSIILVANAIGGSSTVANTGLIGAAANLYFTTNTVSLAATYVVNVYSTGIVSVSDANGSIVANSTVLTLANSSANVAITVPTAAQITNGTYYLNANGMWVVVNTTTPTPGSNTQILFNDSGTSSAVAQLTFNKATYTLGVANTITAGNSTVNAIMTTGGFYINGSLVANTTSFSGTANNAAYLGGTIASSYVTSSSLTGTLASYLTTSAATSTYTSQSQLTANLTNYLSTTTAGTTYQTISGMSSYLTTSSAGSTYLTITTAGTTYQTISGMSSYLTTSSAASTYAPQNNPTFTGTTALNGAYDIKLTAIGNTTTIACNCALSNYFTVTSTGAATVTFTSVPGSMAFNLTMKIANGGANTISWPASVKWPYGTAPTLSANTDFLSFVTDNGGTTWYGALTRKDSR